MKQMGVLLDTSCMVSFFIPDAHHEKAKLVRDRLFRREIQGLISALSLVELCGVVRRNRGEAEARQVKDAITGLAEKGLMSIIPIINSNAYAASDLAISTALKGADAVIVNTAKQTGSQMVTFDEEIKEKAKDQVEFYAP